MFDYTSGVTSSVLSVSGSGDSASVISASMGSSFKSSSESSGSPTSSSFFLPRRNCNSNRRRTMIIMRSIHQYLSMKLSAAGGTGVSAGIVTVRVWVGPRLGGAVKSGDVVDGARQVRGGNARTREQCSGFAHIGGAPGPRWTLMPCAEIV